MTQPVKKKSTVRIEPIRPLKRDLRKFVQFGIDLYANNACYVPPLVFDEIDTFLPEKNPAFEFCESVQFLALRDDVVVGRIAGIINHAVNRKTGNKVVRFGFVDFINDKEVVDALFKAVRTWGRNRGMDTMTGPLGFSDMDREGMLVEGFDEMGTMATIYNYPYYVRHMERMGFVKEADWIEFRMEVPDAIPDKYRRIADIVRRKFNLHTVDLKALGRKRIKTVYGRAIFQLINEAYKDLYGFVRLTERQINYYIDMYLGMLRLEDVCLIADGDDRLVGVGISMPSLSQALRRCDGRLFPTGWYHLHKAMRGGTDTVDLLLVAIAPGYQGKGVNALLFANLIPSYIANGYKFAESNVELETNSNVQKQWEYFKYRQHRRRRAWTKKI